MRRKTLLLLVALATTLTTIGTTAAGAQPPEFPGNDRAAEHARIVEYWTPDRVAQAIPREMFRDGVPTGHKPGHTPGGGGGKPGGGGGGGGGGETAVGGAPWTLGGLVKATTGKVLFTMGGVDYVCSGTVVDDTSNSTSLVLTAGHCVYDSADGFATNWMFYPDYEHAATFDCGSTRYGCWTATALVTTMAWSAGDFDHDYGFAVMGAGGLAGTAQLDSTVGDQAIAFNQQHPAFVYSFGYPHASPYNGQDLIYCSGTDRADTFGGSSTFGLKCDMTGGSSGGGWYIGFDEATGAGMLTSVNSFKYRGGPMKSYMFGPYFGAYAQKTYTAAKTAGGNTLVTP